MFGYTQSPGGVRRGNIWQSSTMGGQGKQDPRRFFFDSRQSSTDSELPTSRYVDSQIIPYSRRWFQWSPSPYNIRPITYSWPYTTHYETDAEGKEVPQVVASGVAQYQDIDARLYPRIGDITPATQTVQPEYGEYTQADIYTQAYSTAAGSYKYYEKMDDPPIDIFGAPVGVQRSAPLRIRGTFVYADFYWSAYNYIPWVYHRPDYEAMHDHFESLLQGLSYPDSSIFSGASVSGRNGGLYTLPFPTLQADEADVSICTYTGASPRMAWTKTQRPLYHGYLDHYQLYISPETMTQYSNNWGRYSWDASTPNDAILLHPYPGFDEIVMVLPYMRRTTPAAIQQPDHPLHRRYEMRDQNLAAVGRLGANAASRNGDIAAYNAFGQIRAAGIYAHTFSGGGDTELVPEITIQPDPSIYFGQLQPQWQKGQKLLVNVSPSVCAVRTGKTTIRDYEHGRFTYIGFKGTISFFELPRQN